MERAEEKSRSGGKDIIQLICCSSNRESSGRKGSENSAVSDFSKKEKNILEITESQIRFCTHNLQSETANLYVSIHWINVSIAIFGFANRKRPPFPDSSRTNNVYFLLYFQFHILISCSLQLLLIFPTIVLIIGATNRVRFLLLPWLIVFGVFQVN